MMNQVDTLIAFALIMLMMSLLMTVLVQVVQVSGQRRGRNLRWGVELLFKQLGLSEVRAASLARTVLTHPAVSADGVSLAEAISSEELISLVEEIGLREKGAAVVTTDVGRLKNKWVALLDASENAVNELLTVERGAGETVEKAADGEGKGAAQAGRTDGKPSLGNEAAEAARELIQRVQKDALAGSQNQRAKRLPEAVVGVVQTLVRSSEKRAPDVDLDTWLADKARIVEQGVDEAIKSASYRSAAARDRLEKWFDMIMERTTERFVAQTRVVTIVLSFLACAVFRIDALAILEELSTNAEVRAALVSQAEGSLQEFEERIELTERSGEAARRSLAAVLAEPLPSADQEAADALRAALAQRLSDDPAPPALRSQVEAWIPARLAELFEAGIMPAAADREAFQGALLAKYTTRVQADLAEVEAQLVDTAREVHADIASLQLDLFGAFDDSGVRWFQGWSWQHLVGIVVAGMLLSLGAPFWFNTLRNLSNLRPAVAKHVEAGESERTGAREGGS